MGKVIRRIIGKCVTRVTKQDVIKASGAIQVCAGQKSEEQGRCFFAKIYEDMFSSEFPKMAKAISNKPHAHRFQKLPFRKFRKFTLFNI